MPRLLPRSTARLPDGITSGLANWWPLSHDTLFAAGSPLDFGTVPLLGTRTGAGVGFDPRGPVNATALSFNGTDYIQLSAAALPAGVNFANPHSIFLWVNIADINGLDIGGGSASQIFVGLTDASGNALRFGNDDGTGGAFFVAATPIGLGFESTYSIGSLANGQWRLIGYTWDGTTSIPYGAGVPTGKQTTTNFSTAAITNVIAARNSSNTGRFTGSLADIRIYNRALSAAEAAQLYASAFTTDEVMPALFMPAAAPPSGYHGMLLGGVG